MKLKEENLLSITGGGFNASLLNSFARLLSIAIEVGRMIGSSIRRVSSKNYC